MQHVFESLRSYLPQTNSEFITSSVGIWKLNCSRHTEYCEIFIFPCFLFVLSQAIKRGWRSQNFFIDSFLAISTFQFQLLIGPLCYGNRIIFFLHYVNYNTKFRKNALDRRKIWNTHSPMNILILKNLHISV